MRKQPSVLALAKKFQTVSTLLADDEQSNKWARAAEAVKGISLGVTTLNKQTPEIQATIKQGMALPVMQ